MNTINIIYWTETGNTLAMAEAIARGVSSAGKEARLITVNEATVTGIANTSVFALGCPAMGNEVLEESEMEPFICAIEPLVSDKHVALFGSYGWGDGQWMRDFSLRMSNAGANVMNEEGLICQEAPDSQMLAQCEELGRQMAHI